MKPLGCTNKLTNSPLPAKRNTCIRGCQGPGHFHIQGFSKFSKIILIQQVDLQKKHMRSTLWPKEQITLSCNTHCKFLRPEVSALSTRLSSAPIYISILMKRRWHVKLKYEYWSAKIVCLPQDRHMPKKQTPLILAKDNKPMNSHLKKQTNNLPPYLVLHSEI